VQKEHIAASVAADVGDIRTLADSWRISLQARNLSGRTLRTYTESLDSFTAFALANGMPTQASSISREHVDTWLADLASKFTPATVRNRYTGGSAVLPLGDRGGRSVRITDATDEAAHAPRG
jgi:hypothetical protein